MVKLSVSLPSEGAENTIFSTRQPGAHTKDDPSIELMCILRSFAISANTTCICLNANRPTDDLRDPLLGDGELSVLPLLLVLALLVAAHAPLVGLRHLQRG